MASLRLVKIEDDRRRHNREAESFAGMKAAALTRLGEVTARLSMDLERTRKLVRGEATNGA